MRPFSPETPVRPTPPVAFCFAFRYYRPAPAAQVRVRAEQRVAALLGFTSRLEAEEAALVVRTVAGRMLAAADRLDGRGFASQIVPHTYPLLATMPERDRLFTTPHGADLAALTRAAGVPHVLVERARELPTAVGGTAGVRVVEVRVDPERDRAVRNGVGRTVSEAIEKLG